MTELKADKFKPRAHDPDISVNWFDLYEGNDTTRIDEVCRDMSAERELRASHKLALLKADVIREIGADCGHDLDAVHDSLPGNESHALITGVPLDDGIVHQELADEASTHLVPAVKYKKGSGRNVR